MAFSLPPIKDPGIDVPSFSISELCSLPSTALTSLANTMASYKSELDIKNSQLQTRANKLSGGVTLPDSVKGRNMVDTTISSESIDTSVESTIAPVTSTAGIFDTIEKFGADILNNPIAAGTSIQDAIDMGKKVSELYKGAKDLIDSFSSEEDEDE